MTSPRIFVQIASYRDPECQWTIKDLFTRAKYPDRVFVGVCWQFVAEEDADCFVVSTRPKQVRTLEFDASESRGVGWARHQTQKLWQGEEYVLQIDSHMRFVDDWDTKMIDMLGQCPSPKPILTTYPPGYKPPDTRLSEPVAKLRCRRFLDSGVVTFINGGEKEVSASAAPSPDAFCAAGFLFAPAQIIEQVPYDPYIYFVGEEISLSVRLWTNGWDFFAPNKVLIYHYYGLRDKYRRHNVGRRDGRDLDRFTTSRVKHLLGMENSENPAVLVDIEKYGLGQQRSLREYEEFSGINFRARTIAQYAKSWPYHLTESAKSDRDNAHQQPALADTAQAFVIGDGGVVFSEPAQEIYHFNRAAMFIWCGLEEGDRQAKIVGALGSSLGLPEDQADVLLTEILRHWWDLGLLANSPLAEDTADRALRQGRNIGAHVDTENFPEETTLHGAKQRTYRLLSATVQVLFETTEQEARFHPVVAHLETKETSDNADAIVSIITRGQHHFVYLDDEPNNHCRDIAALGPMIKGLILQAGINSQTYFMCIHSGVVTDGSTCLLFPGESGRGKSSLTAAFVKSGYTYCSDEIALLSKSSCEVTPAPAAMCIKESGFENMAKLYQKTSELAVHDRVDSVLVRYFLPPDGRLDRSVGGPMPVQRIIFPNYDPSRPTNLASIDKAEALRVILAECMAIPTKLDHLGVAEFVRWIRDVECYQLTLSSLDDAVAMGKRLLAEREPAALRRN